MNNLCLTLYELPIAKKDRQKFITELLVSSHGVICTDPICDFCEEFDKGGNVYICSIKAGKFLYVFLRLFEDDEPKYTICINSIESTLKDLFNSYNLELYSVKAD